MSNARNEPESPLRCPPGVQEDCLIVLDAGISELGTGLVVRRALPRRQRRTIGAWCFLDHFGPLAYAQPSEGMQVGAHPHIGLQTVTWLTEGEVLHRDSLGTVATIRAGGLNVMTAGRGIAHTEETPGPNGGNLHGLQLWLALPSSHAEIAPAFEHVESVPRWTDAGVTADVFVGRGLESTSSATVHSPLLGADVAVTDGRHRLPLQPGFEHGIVVMEGAVRVDGTTIRPGQLAYLGPGRSDLVLESDGPARFGLVGGEPFDEEIILWWNFVGRSVDEIRAAREDWLAGTRFGAVDGYAGAPLDTPELLLSSRRR